MNASGQILQSFYHEHIMKMSHPVEKYARGEMNFQPPYLNSSILLNILDLATTILAEEPIVLDIKVPIYIVGDLHGHLFDLYRIFQIHGLPPESKYLFLGDFVDRGVYSTEIVTLVAVLKILFPKDVYLIRGNHEFIPTKPNSGFVTEIQHLYSNYQEVLTKFYNYFSFIPLAARVGDYLCVHGGIDPGLQTIDQIASLRRPIQFDHGLVEGIVWSDPKPDQVIPFFSSPRGHGYYFSEGALNDFLNQNMLKGLIRGHQFVDGILSQFDGKLITVFSASNYIPDYDNNSGVLYIDSNNFIIPRLYPPLYTPPRGTIITSSNEKKLTKNTENNCSCMVPKITSCKKLTRVHSDMFIKRPRAHSSLPALHDISSITASSILVK